MGYNTEFRGTLKFSRDLTGPELARLKSMLGEDCRDHPEWEVSFEKVPAHDTESRYSGLSHMDIELTDDFDGIKWNGSEKTYDLVDKINLITAFMREAVSDFRLTGFLEARGEEFDDSWKLVIDECGWATREKVEPPQNAVTCPHCTHRFVPGDEDATYRY